MIKANKNSVEIKGTEPELLTELAIIIKNLHEDVSKEQIIKAVDLAFMTEEELEANLKNKVKEFLNLLLKDD